MDIKQLINEINQSYQEAGADQLEAWLGTLSTTFAVTAEELGEVKKNRALKEIKIKKGLISRTDLGNGQAIEYRKILTEKEVEREYYATSEGQYLVYNTELLKALSKLISSIRFKLEAFRGKFN